MKKSILLGIAFAAAGTLFAKWCWQEAFASRSSGGTYSLPSGNPVVTGTTISSSWANTTLSDIATALTNSLDRTGATGGMTGVLKAYDGTASSPGIQWSSDSDTGLYRIGANDLGLAVNGVLNEEWTVYGTTTTAASAEAASSQVAGITGMASAAGVYVGANADGGGIIAVGRGDYGVGVYGQGGGSATYSALPTGAQGAGVVGAANKSANPGVFGWGSGATKEGAGVIGLGGTNGVGVYGKSTISSGVGVLAGVGGLKIALDGNVISASYGNSYTITMGSIAAGGCNGQSESLTGVVAGCVCNVSPDAELGGSGHVAITAYCAVTGANSITIFACNGSGSSFSSGSGPYRVRAFCP